MVLERAEEFSLLPETINMIQTSLQLMGNANYHHSTERRKALLQHLNPLLKQLIEESDFKEAPAMLFGENFGVLAKQRIDAAAALKKILVIKKGKRGFWQSHLQKNWGQGGYSSMYSGQRRGWQPRGNKVPKKTQQPKK